MRVVGVGNPTRGDDGVGPAVAGEVAALDVDVVVSTADPTNLIDRWGSADTVVLVDAVVSEADAGTVTVLDALVDELPVDLETLSSHGLGVPGTVALARSLGRLPARLIVIGVTGKEFDGVGLSAEVEDAIPDAVQAVMEVVDHA